MRIRIADLRELLQNKLLRVGFTKSEAVIIAEEYIVGEIKGKRAQGVFVFIRAYLSMKGDYQASTDSQGDLKLLRNRKKRRHFKIAVDKPAYAFIDGHNDIGQLVAERAIKLVVQKAKRSGIAMVGGGKIQAFLRPGSWAEKAAQQGMIALCFNYGGGPLMAPTGAREPILSTNPIGIGIPYKPYPIVIDMATSARAYYHVRLAKELGMKIDPRWAIDRLGRPTTNPNKVAAVLPFGGYKGYALALAFEILTGPLVRTAVGKSTKLYRGFLFIVINPLAFTTRQKFQADVNRLIRDVKTARKIRGVKDIHIPGEQSWEIERRNRKRGYIDIDNAVIQKIRNL